MPAGHFGQSALPLLGSDRAASSECDECALLVSPYVFFWAT
jgi:hypothetical protein